MCCDVTNFWFLMGSIVFCLVSQILFKKPDFLWLTEEEEWQMSESIYAKHLLQTISQAKGKN